MHRWCWFFNPATPLGAVTTRYFDTVLWSRETGVTDPDSTKNQVALACEHVRIDSAQPHLLFMNISAIHQPNCHYLEGCEQDNVVSHRRALEYVDGALAPLFEHIQQRASTVGRPCQIILLSDHGTTYGEDGFRGHGCAHEIVWTVPYAEARLEPV